MVGRSRCQLRKTPSSSHSTASSTTVSQLDGLAELADQILIMSVEPGFGGQAFQTTALEKIEQLATSCDSGTTIAIDGGIGPTTIASAHAAGARVFVAGSAILQSDNYQAAIQSLKTIATSPLTDEEA